MRCELTVVPGQYPALDAWLGTHSPALHVVSVWHSSGEDVCHVRAWDRGGAEYVLSLDLKYVLGISPKPGVF